WRCFEVPVRTGFQPISPRVRIDVADDVDRCAYAVRLRRENDQLLHRLLARGSRRLQYSARNHSLGKVVQSLEPSPPSDSEQALVVQISERRLATGPSP